VIHLVTAVKAAQGEHMTSTIPEETGTAPASAAGGPPKATKKARVGARRAHVAPATGKSAKKSSSAKKAPKGRRKAAVAHDGSKVAKILDLLKRPGAPRPQNSGRPRAGSRIPFAASCRGLWARRWA